MKGATLVENATLAKLRSRYCTLQFHKATIEDQQSLLMVEIERVGRESRQVSRQTV